MLNSLLKRILPARLRVGLRFNLLKIRGLFYAGNARHCTCCGGRFRKFLSKKDVKKIRHDVVCPKCGVVERHRMLMLYLETSTNFFKEEQKVLHFAPEYSTQKKFKSLDNIDYHSADLKSALAMEHFDIMEIPYPDQSFSYIECFLQCFVQVRDKQSISSTIGMTRTYDQDFLLHIRFRSLYNGKLLRPD